MKFLVNLARGKQAEVELMDERAERGIVKTGFVKNITEDMSEREMAVKTGGFVKVADFYPTYLGQPSVGEMGGALWNGARNVGNAIWNAPGKAYGFMKGLFTPKPLVNNGEMGDIDYNGLSKMKREADKKKIEANTPKGSWLGKFTGWNNMKDGFGQMKNTFKNVMDANGKANAALTRMNNMSGYKAIPDALKDLASKSNGTGMTGMLKSVWNNKQQFMPGLKTFGKGLGKTGLIAGGTMMAGKMLRGLSKPYQPPAQYMSPQQPMQPYYNQPMYAPQQPMQPRGYYNQGRYYR